MVKAQRDATARPLLQTKLYPPRWRTDLVPRRHLVERLERGTTGKLTLVSAPAGAGKTTLAGEWLAEHDGDVAWLALDPADSDPAFFWSYVIAALQVVDQTLGANALTMLHGPQPAPIEAVLATLLNDLSRKPRDLTLLLDDYHVIESAQVHDALSYLVDHLPPGVHLVILSRADPALPLARLRTRGELLELRAADLRFTSSEAAALLNDLMNLGLTAADIEVLGERTEGWIAGLQLAALSMQGRDDVAGFIAAFTGDDRYVMDFLVEEVLAQESDHVRDFLLRASVLDRLTGPLCDHLTGRPDGRETLERLDRRNLFVVPLDSRRRWYRFHHLFAEVLRAHLVQTDVDVPALHVRASEWFEKAGDAPDAIAHALRAEDFDRAARLIESVARELVSTYQPLRLLAWLRQIPDEVLLARPVLSAYQAFALFPAGEMEAAIACLDAVEQWLADRPTEPPAGTDPAELDSLPGVVAIARAYYAMAAGDIAGTIDLARRALDVLSEAELTWRGGAQILLALAEWWTGDLAAATEAHDAGVASLVRSGDLPLAVSAIYDSAALAQARASLSDAQQAHERALRLAEEAGTPTIPGVADAHIGLSAVALERNDLSTAAAHLEEAEALARLATLPETPSRVAIGRALLREATGDWDAALQDLDEAERLMIPGPVPGVPPHVHRARLLLRQGRDVDEWISSHELSPDDSLTYASEPEHVELARALVERAPADALSLIDRLLADATRGDRSGTVLVLLLLRARAHHALGATGEAMTALRAALDLAEPEGYVRTFVAEGEQIRELLRAAVGQGISTAYASRLLEAFGEAPPLAPENDALPEPLTRREVEILRLIAAGMRNQEIADELVISVATVKRHIANTYGKLGVDYRTEAVARANELRLI